MTHLEECLVHGKHRMGRGELSERAQSLKSIGLSLTLLAVGLWGSHYALSNPNHL